MSDPTIQPIIMSGSMLRDDNDSPVLGTGLTISNSKTLVGSGTTVAVPLFHVTGCVQILAIWGNVTTALLNNTAAYWRLNDQTAQVSITASSGTALTNATVGCTIVKKDLASAALTLINASAGRISEPTTLETPYFSPFVALQKTENITTDIEFVYTTSDTPTSGVINFYVQYLPIGSGSRLTVV